MTVAGLRKNGEEALAHCRRDMPHILITDIGMPVMDGLELIREAKRLHPHLKVIILSCHDEFHFAQQAVKLNVNDYILKETMQPETMIELLEKVRQQLEEEHASKLGRSSSNRSSIKATRC
ncbi:hypothetical protein SD70_11865 [Gordoniibacillus kamchatkensis]|uniref:Response regulatory domain-containing protein n=2 Tax=Gordoniibacillus kamchatkensis TaxID=1590651 RepID=A0ABR5AI78_9BACL|nr:hypothetical protein SD70_11865 [Paenibacillus sp. VKM B-2647]